MEISGSIVIVTGASSGIGAATARALARRGATVVLAARRAEALRALADEIGRAGGQALAVPTDVGKLDEIERLVATAVERYGRVDVLVNNAGINAGRTLTNGDDATLQRMIDTNLLAPARCVQAVLPHMRRQRRGIIINIGSVAGEIATNSLYAATKFGLRGLSDGLRRELRADRIAVVLIAPGFIRTPMTEGLKLPMPGPEAVAAAIADAIRRPRRRIVVPPAYLPLLYLGKVLPGLADWLLGSRRFQKSYHDRKQFKQPLS